MSGRSFLTERPPNRVQRRHHCRRSPGRMREKEGDLRPFPEPTIDSCRSHTAVECSSPARVLTELAHVDSVLVASELEAAPALLVAIFLASLLIGLRSAKPIELARRRQLEFTSDASHELRTPLAVIEAELSLARESAGPTEPETLERISEESDRLKHIVEDLLWLARFDSAPPPPVSGPVDVSKIVGGLRRSLQTPCGRSVGRPCGGVGSGQSLRRSSHQPSGSIALPRYLSTMPASMRASPGQCWYGSAGPTRGSLSR